MRHPTCWHVICKRVPGWDYQFEQLLKEETFGTLTRTLQEEYYLLDERDVAGTKQFLAHVAALSYPAHHSAAMPLNDFALEVHWDLFKLCTDSMGLAEAGCGHLRRSSTWHSSPTTQLAVTYSQRARLTPQRQMLDTERLVPAVEYLRRALRLRMVLAGREAGSRSTMSGLQSRC
jgi:hypothetical protein